MSLEVGLRVGCSRDEVLAKLKRVVNRRHGRSILRSAATMPMLGVQKSLVERVQHLRRSGQDAPRPSPADRAANSTPLKPVVTCYHPCPIRGPRPAKARAGGDGNPLRLLMSVLEELLTGHLVFGRKRLAIRHRLGAWHPVLVGLGDGRTLRAGRESSSLGFVNSQKIPFFAPHALRNTGKVRKLWDALSFADTGT